MKHKILGLLVGGLTLAATAGAANAATVSVEIEGKNLVVPPTAVQTPASVTNNGESCANGASVLGALDTVTKGDWRGVKYGISAPDTILGELHSFDENQGNWVYVVNGKTVNDTACNAPVADGDAVLWFWSSGVAPYKAAAGYDDPVLLTAPTTAVPGQPFTITVRDTLTSYDGPGGTGQTTITPSSDATVSGGAVAATTGADGTTQVTVAGGPYTLIATKGNRAPARIAGCATNGADGFCGTTAAAASPQPQAAPAPVAPAAPTGLKAITEGKKYKKGAGPRELAGHVAAPAAGLKDVRLRLTRNDGGRCSTFDGKKEAFVTLKRCGAKRGTWFSVGAKQDFTYLLPAKLGRGRYVLDLEVIDRAGRTATKLARGTTRVVFTVA